MQVDLGGGHEIEFVMAPNLHWPDTMFTFDHATGAPFELDRRSVLLSATEDASVSYPLAALCCSEPHRTCMVVAYQRHHKTLYLVQVSLGCCAVQA